MVCDVLGVCCMWHVVYVCAVVGVICVCEGVVCMMWWVVYVLYAQMCVWCGVCVCCLTSLCAGGPTLFVSVKVTGGSRVSCPLSSHSQPDSLEPGSPSEPGALVSV